MLSSRLALLSLGFALAAVPALAQQDKPVAKVDGITHHRR
jgi:peptidyl-prolyl cis-trans isomerase C